MKSLSKELRQLEQQRDRELRNAAFEFSRLKRDTRRAFAPDRIIRRHPVAALISAAVAGMLVAPGPPRARPVWRSRLRWLFRRVTWIKNLLHPPKPSQANQAPATNHAPAAAPPPQNPMRSLIMEILPVVLGQLNIEAILQSFLRPRQNDSPPPSAEESALQTPPDAPGVPPQNEPSNSNADDQIHDMTGGSVPH